MVHFPSMESTLLLLISMIFYVILHGILVVFCDAMAQQVLVTGGTGVLGQSLIKGSLARGCDAYFTYRDSAKAQLLFDQGIDSGKGFYLDLAENKPYEDSLVARHLSTTDCEEYVLINNAGIGLPGTDISTLKTTLQTNCVAATELSMYFLSHVKEQSKRHASKPRLTVVHVSSGDGELVFLHSEIRRQIESLNSTMAWQAYLMELMTRGVTDDRGASLIHYAVGPTPAYSLSKALLNAHTRLWQQELINAGLQESVRVIAVCPGNFLSPMSQPEELETALPVEEAARHVLDVALGDAAGGLFYRYGEVIDW